MIYDKFRNTQKQTVIIGEAGVNHNGSEKLAFELIDAALASGVDIVKFQTFKASKVATHKTGKAEYQKINTPNNESQVDMLSRLELPLETHKALFNYCEKLKLEYLSTAFDYESLNFLTQVLGLKTLKIPSGEITNAPFLLEHAKTGCDLIVSTGMCSLGNIEEALGIIAFGLIAPKDTPSIQSFRDAYASNEGQKALKEKITLLHCTSDYPAEYTDINMNAMLTLKNSFQLNVGYSDHSIGDTASVCAVAIGATILEKHFTLDKQMEGPDHQASLDRHELTRYVSSIRLAENCMGTSTKFPTVKENSTINIARRSIVALNSISLGEKLSTNNIGIRRPGTGTSPIHYWSRLDTESTKTYETGDLIE